jgi:hypothetical protein
VALIIPSTKGIFSTFNKALKDKPTFIGLGKDSEVGTALLDLTVLVIDLSKRATHIKKLVLSINYYDGHCNACATGAGGIWMSGKAGLSGRLLGG